MRKRRKWFVVPVGGADITIYAADPSLIADDQEAYYDIEAGEVLISWNCEHTRACVLALHELIHACFGQVGYGHSLPKLFGCQPEEMADIEENVVTHLAPVLFATRLLRFPAFPRKKRNAQEDQGSSSNTG